MISIGRKRDKDEMVTVLDRAERGRGEALEFLNETNMVIKPIKRQ